MAGSTDIGHRTAAANAHAIGAVTGLAGALSCSAAGSKLVCEGDSITAGVTGRVTYPQLLAWLNGYPPIINYGVSGSHLHDVIARLPAVIAAKPSRCILLCGTNDIAANDTDATMLGYVATINSTLLAAGIAPVWCAVLPRADSDKKAAIRSFNRELAIACYASGIQFIDTHTPFCTATGDVVAGLLGADNLHPSDTGRLLLASTIAAKVSIPTVSEAWRYPGEASLFANGDMSLDTNADGLADGWTKQQTGTATASLSAHETAGNWQKLALAAGGTYAHLTVDFGTGGAIVGGDTFDVAFDLKTNASLAGDYVTAKVYYQNAAWAALATDYVMLSQYAPLTTAMRIRNTLTAPATTAHASLQVQIWGAGASDFSIGRLFIRKRTVV